jgi:hypothetical protein
MGLQTILEKMKWDMGFSTRYLEDRDIRLVKFSNCRCLFVVIIFFQSCTIGLKKLHTAHVGIGISVD